MVQATTETLSGESVDSLPDWAREKLTKANNEAARYRTERNTAVEEAKAALTAEHTVALEAATAATGEVQDKLTRSELDLAKIKAVLGLEVPIDKVLSIAELVKGDTEDEVKAHAQSVAGLFAGGAVAPVVRATDPSIGTGAVASIPLNGNPILDAIKKAVKYTD